VDNAVERVGTVRRVPVCGPGTMPGTVPRHALTAAPPTCTDGTRAACGQPRRASLVTVWGAACPPSVRRVTTTVRPGGRAVSGVPYGASVPRRSPDAAASADGDSAGNVVEVRRSARRRRTVTAYREMGRTVVLIPAAFSPAEERRWVAQMVAKLQTREERRRRSLGGDTELMTRARALSAAHLDGLAEPVSVRWVDNQHRRWGSCTPADGSIRLSSRLRSMPDYVVDYVLVHELVHLLEPGHDDRFWALVARYPRAERARGFLEGVEQPTHGAETPEGTPAGDAVDRRPLTARGAARRSTG
jgi:predicted metal-dependent hydrolase